MKYIALIVSLAFASYAFSQDGDHPTDHPTDQPADHPTDHPTDQPADHPTDHPTDQPSDHPTDHPSEHPATAASDQAKVLLDAVHDAYKGATAVKDTITMTLPAFMPGEDPEVIDIVTLVGSDSGSFVISDQLEATWVNDRMFVSVSGFDDAYAAYDANAFFAGMQSAAGDQGMPGVWTLALRESNEMDDWISSLSMGMPGVEVTDVTSATDDSGSTSNVIALKTMMGTIDIQINDSDRIDNVTLTMTQPGGASMVISMDSTVTFLDDMPKIRFDAGDRTELDSLEAVFASGEEEAQVDDTTDDNSALAPDFTLSQMDGSGNVTLSDLKGEVVVLDFWATWCGPCKKGLPYLNEFDAWVKENGLNVKVFAVNVWERGDASAIDKKVKSFWADNKYNASVLMGSDAKKLTDNYKVSGIPTTVIVGRDGSIIDSHSGFSGGEAMLTRLKETVGKALK